MNIDREADPHPEILQHVNDHNTEEDGPVYNLEPILRLEAFMLPFVAEQNLWSHIREARCDHNEKEADRLASDPAREPDFLRKIDRPR